MRLGKNKPGPTVDKGLRRLSPSPQVPATHLYPAVNSPPLSLLAIDGNKKNIPRRLGRGKSYLMVI